MANEEVKKLFIEYYAKMYRVARSILYDEQESKDVVSDIFERLLYGHTVLLPETAERYLLTSVRNQCIKRLNHNDIKGSLPTTVPPVKIVAMMMTVSMRLWSSRQTISPNSSSASLTSASPKDAAMRK